MGRTDFGGMFIVELDCYCALRIESVHIDPLTNG